MTTHDVQSPPGELETTEVDIPQPPPLHLPRGGVLWQRAFLLLAVGAGLYLLDRLALLMMDFWLLQSLGYESVFWTNFRAGALLFGVALAAFGVAIALPAFTHGVERTLRRRAVYLGLLGGAAAGYLLSAHYRTFLLAQHGEAFGRSDPVFGHDFAFYIFDLPAWVTTLNALIILSAVLFASAVGWAYAAQRAVPQPPGVRRVSAIVGAVSTRLTVGALVALGVLVAVRIWIARYDVLVKDNADSSVYSGAEYLDVTGFFSTVNGYTVSALAVLFGAGALALRLSALRRATLLGDRGSWRRIGVVSLVLALLPGLAIDFAFRGVTALRHETQVSPNEPVVQLPYIERHIEATRAAYGLGDVEVEEFVPNGPDDPAPDVEALLASPTLRNAPLWPGFVSWFERQLDPEYVERTLAGDEEDEALIYGPTLDTFRAQQKLRPYYDVMDIDTVRYHIDGEDVLMASGVRELPLADPQPWLAWWGQRFLLYTHGHGLVMSPVAESTDAGEPDYAMHQIPPETRFPELEMDTQAIYYGEGSGSMGYSNVREVPEHDYPTEQGRAEVFFPEDVEAGVRVDSFLKRLVFGYKSRQFLDVIFSDLVESNTRVHYFRTPLERIERIAPFLYPDTDPYAVVREGGPTWMVNGMTTTDRYPYSVSSELGDKSVSRTPTPRPLRDVNYVKDSVKVTVDALTGQTSFYKWVSEPVVDSWARIYPDLFTEAEEMPSALREQVQYPMQLFHVQFDDLYIYYHMQDPLTFFSLEDLFDDGDEVVGPILDEGRSITFSIEPYHWVAEAGGALPEAEDPSQFSLSMIFTPESALNLRAIATAYQEGDDYGRLTMLQVPKGHFYPGPEQADTAIDQDAFISQQIGLWNRMGLEVLRGHTTPLVVGREVLYVEPLFIRSKQNPVPQLKRVIAVYRGEAFMGRSLEEALRSAVAGERGGDLEFTQATAVEVSGE